MAQTNVFDLPKFFQALGDDTRLRLLNLMGEQEVCVCYFVEILGAPQPAYLRSAGIVAARREGKWMHYRIAMPPHRGAAQMLRQTLKSLKDDRGMREDRSRLAKACCSPAKYSLDGAPMPIAVSESFC
jgi:ArsR family transcriptional regulator